MEDIAQFVRQLSHDLRNHLNAAELQAAYINEVAEDAELKSELQRLRSMLSEMGGSLGRLTTSLAPVTLTEMPYEAVSFMEDLREKIATQFTKENLAIEWKLEVGNAMLQIDPQFLQQAFLELFANAVTHAPGGGPLLATAETRDGEFHFTLREPKEAETVGTEQWGRQPFRKVRHGHYGLGLRRVRAIIDAHHGRLDARSEASALVTTVVLPLAVEQK